MIGSDQNIGKELIAGFRLVAKIDELPAMKLKEFEDLAVSANIDRFPGVILAWPRTNGCTIYFAVTKTAAEWRRLHPLLLAYVGPTLTAFNGLPDSLDAGVAVEKFLLCGDWHLIVRLVPGSDVSVQKMTHRSLKRLIETISTVVYASQVVPMPTSLLLSKFFNSLNGHDLQEARRILDLLRLELRVDALNLSFLEVQIYAHFGDWRSISEMPSFISLTRTRRPPAVTSALLETLYQVYLAPIDPELSIEETRQKYLEVLSPLVRPMLRMPPPNNLACGGWRIYALEALCVKDRNPALVQLCIANSASVGPGLTAVLEALGVDGRSDDAAKEKSTLDTVVLAKEALSVAIEVDSLVTIKGALEGVQNLSVEQRFKLLESEPFRTIWRTLNAESKGVEVSENWLNWLENVREPGFDNSLTIARRGLDEWPVQVLQSSVFIESLALKLMQFPDESSEYDRLVEALPLLVAWVLKDSNYPRLAMMPVYETLLYHMVASSRRGITVLESGIELIRGMLSVGISKSAYKTLLDDALDLIGLGIGTRAVDCVLDLVEETLACQSPDPEVRQGFWFQILSRIQPIVRHLSPIQLISLTRLGDGLGWQSDDVKIVAEQMSGSSIDKKVKFIEALRGKTIGIYSLTEAAARQGEVLLKGLIPDIRVTLSSEHDGSPMLKSMAIGADIVVMVTASATHAATTFIQHHRPRGLPVLYARGKGCTSILRAIEEYVQNSIAKQPQVLTTT